MNALAIVILLAASAGDPTDDAIQAAIRDLHSRTISMSEFLGKVRRSRSAGPTGAALATLLRLASEPDAMLAFPANLALLDNDFYLSDEEFGKADSEWRRYVSSDRWFAASSGTPSVRTSNELVTRSSLNREFALLAESKARFFDTDPRKRRDSLAPLLKLDTYVHDESLPLKLAKSADPLVRVAEIQAGGERSLHERRQEFAEPIRKCLRSGDWLAIQQGLRWGKPVLNDFDAEVERLLREGDLNIRLRTARFVAENDRVPSNVVDIVKEGLRSNDVMNRCSALVLLRLAPKSAPDFKEEIRAALADPNAVVSGVAASTVDACPGPLGNSIRGWCADPNPLVRYAVLSTVGRPYKLSRFLEHGDIFLDVPGRGEWTEGLLPRAIDRVKDSDSRVRAAAVDAIGFYSRNENAVEAHAALRSLTDSPDGQIADRAMKHLSKRWKLVKALDSTKQAMALDRIIRDFQSTDWETHCDARCVLANRPELAVPRLIPLLENTASAPLCNKLILEHYPLENETGACFSMYFIHYELDRIDARAAHLVEMLTCRDFGFVHEKLWNLRDEVRNPDGRRKLDDDPRAERRDRNARAAAAAAKAKAWWTNEGKKYSRFQSLIDALKSADVGRQRQALEYLTEGAAACDGLTEQSWRTTLRPLVKALETLDDEEMRNRALHLLNDETLDWLKLKTGEVWTTR